MTCIICGQPIEEGRIHGQPPRLAKYCLKCRAGPPSACESEVHVATRVRRPSQGALFRWVESSLSSPQPLGSNDWLATLVHQASGRAVGFNNAP